MAGQFTTTEKTISIFEEVTPCTPPADWAASGTPIEFISINLDAVAQEQIVDPTAEARHFAVGNRQRRPGRRNGTHQLVVKQHGTGVVTADGDTVVQTYLGTLWKHCVGAVHLGTSHVITGGTATQPILDDVTGIVPGCMLAFQDTTSPTTQNLGMPVCRRVLAISTLTLTLSEALPWTPAAGDPVHAAITVYPHAHNLRDAVAAGGTLALYVREGDDESLNTRLDGCVHSAKLEGLALGSLPTLTMEGMHANWARGTQDDLADIADLGEPEGQPQLSMGIDVSISIQEYGNTAINEIDAAAVTFETGVTRSRVETVTGKIHRFHGTATYTVAQGQTTMAITIAAHLSDYYEGMTAGTAYRITMTQPGSGAGAGSGWCVHMPKARLVATPGKGDVNGNYGTTLSFEATEPSDTTGGSLVDLQKARFVVAMF
jgi:hypothetical protein